MEVRSFETQWGGKTLKIETGKLAQRAGGSCTVQYGDTVVLAAATKSREPREGIDFFPLTVEYEEKLYASGKIKKSKFVKREGRPTDEAIMTGRMIDRAIRPIFPKGITHEVQVVIECLSADLENPSDMVGMAAAVCAISISEIPWEGPIASVRVGRINGEWVINPTFEAQKKSDMSVIVAGTPDKILMLEANCSEIPEEEMNEAILFGQKHLKEVIGLVNEVAQAVGKKKVPVAELSGEKKCDEKEEECGPGSKQEKDELVGKGRDYLESRFEEVLFSTPKLTKSERSASLKKLKHELDEHLKEQQIGKEKRKVALEEFYNIVEDAVTRSILEQDRRVDGRTLTEVRPLLSEVGLLPRTHGSGLFNRGETQVLSIVTLGPPGDAQIIEGMEEEFKKRYIHHYGFPPFSCAETGRLGGAGRREIGHGGLAERALTPVLPDKEKFPYTIRIVSEVLSSNGSSSQAAICGSTLALMDAGVPIKNPVAGIAMGVSTDDKGSYRILTDIQDLEDGKGGMDFKVGGTRKGITTIQLDTKTKGLSKEIIWDTLQQAKQARMEILDIMAKAIAEPRAELSPYAPRLESFKIDVEKIRDVIGPGGKTINGIIDETGATIDIEQDGTVTVSSISGPSMERAIEMIKRLTKNVEVGEVYKEGKVVRILDFGAFVELTPNQDGMVHVSEIAPWHVNKVTDVLKVGDIVPVKVIAIDELGRINLSIKRAKQELGIEQKNPNPEPPRHHNPNNPGRGPDNGPRPRPSHGTSPKPPMNTGRDSAPDKGSAPQAPVEPSAAPQQPIEPKTPDNDQI